MKSNIIILILFAAVFASCSKLLEEKPKGFVNPADYYRNEAECQAAVNYLYAPLYGFYRAQLLIAVDLTSDLSYFSGNTDPSTDFSISPAQPGAGAVNTWNFCYSGIKDANNAIVGISRSPISDEIKDKLKAEAYFMRGFYYYMLTEMFNDVPFFLEEVRTAEDAERIARLPRMSAKETRTAIINNLISSMEALPVKQPENASYQRASRQAAHMLVSKMAMKNGDYSLAKEHLLKIRDIYGILDPVRYRIEDTWLSKKNTPESIFEVQYLYNPQGIMRNSGTALFLTPPITAAGTDVFDGVQIPFIGKYASRTSPAIPTNYFLNLYDKIKADLDPARNNIDPRTNIILAYHYNGKPFDRVVRGGKPYFGIKFWAPNMINTTDGNNQRVFRYADALLMLAECYNEGPDRDPQKALELLKEIRQRVGYISFFSSTAKNAILKEIQDERARELFGEYQRKFDLVRWGIYYEQMRNTAEIPVIYNNVRPYHRYFPIPDAQVLRSGGILTNEDYQ